MVTLLAHGRLKHPEPLLEGDPMSLAAQVADPSVLGPVLSEGAESAPDIVDEWGMQSFPASDPPSNW